MEEIRTRFSQRLKLAYDEKDAIVIKQTMLSLGRFEGLSLGKSFNEK